MNLNWVDYSVFLGFIALVIFVGLWKSVRTKEECEHEGVENYFLAGRGLAWWLVGFSLIAANISTEQFVGMSGSASNKVGLAIASYEWIAAVSLVIVAFVFLPKFLRAGVYTIPEFLEHRFTPLARWLMALCMMVMLVGVPTSAVIYSGAKVLCVYFADVRFMLFDTEIWLGDLTVGCWIIGVLAALYVFAGGLKACAWADLFQGSALIIGGAIIAGLALVAVQKADPATLTPAQGMSITQKDGQTNVKLQALLASAMSKTPENSGAQTSSSELAPKVDGALERLFVLNGAPAEEGGKLHMSRPATDSELPWTALLLGIWIPNLYYWGLNQYIVQRTLGSRSLAAGQKGLVFAAFLKLIIPFIVVIPGILAWNLYREDLRIEATTNTHQVDVIEAYAHRGETKTAPPYFKFDQNYAELNPGFAEELYRTNCALKGVAPITREVADAAEAAVKATEGVPDNATETKETPKTPENVTPVTEASVATPEAVPAPAAAPAVPAEAAPADTTTAAPTAAIVLKTRLVATHGMTSLPMNVYAQWANDLEAPIPAIPVSQQVTEEAAAPAAETSTPAAPVAAEATAAPAETVPAPADAVAAPAAAEVPAVPEATAPAEAVPAPAVEAANKAADDGTAQTMANKMKRVEASQALVADINANRPATLTPQQIYAANQALLTEVAEAGGKTPSAVSTELIGYDHNSAFPILLKKLLADKTGWGVIGFVLASLFGAIVSSLAAMLNSASTIATMDIYKKLHKSASDKVLVGMGRIFIVIFVGIAIWIAPMLDRPVFGGIFTFIQEFQGFISPGILAVFLFGMFVPWAPRVCGIVGLLMSPIIYGICKFYCPVAIPFISDVPVQDWAFLNRMALTFTMVMFVLLLLTIFHPMKRSDLKMPVNDEIELTTSIAAIFWGVAVLVVTASLYWIFW